MKKDNLHTNDNGFKIPEGYFDNFEKKLMNHIDADMSKNTSETGFKVPDDYFESLEDGLFQKISNEKPKGKVISLFSKRNIFYFSGIAAMIAIIFSVVVTKQSDSLDFNTLAIADIQAYYDEGNIELSSIEIASLLEEEVNYLSPFEEKSISDDALLEYLSDEDLDDEIIFSE
ncbi:hypothetical protein [Aquimarina sp. MMG016]|uniref:hypothetical protein n=1 Tax=Aquimarina sp. MMG016 TaxID=2822690 RepID=UPI001B3A3108|nr:hypothetical protein [Aquimarina sp. MMG016]MBQ4821808.1 hypothetical protein [Aquimarina sp. MMG016]